MPNILAASEAELYPLICKVGFHNKKLVYLKQVAEVLHTKYNDDIPDSVEELCQLPGIGASDHCKQPCDLHVGPKMAYITMHAAWDK